MLLRSCFICLTREASAQGKAAPNRARFVLWEGPSWPRCPSGNRRRAVDCSHPQPATGDSPSRSHLLRHCRAAGNTHPATVPLGGAQAEPHHSDTSKVPPHSPVSLHLLGRAEAAAHPVRVPPAKGDASRLQARMELDSVPAALPESPQPQLCTEPRTCLHVRKAAPTGTGSAASSWDCWHCLGAQGWELEILNEMSFPKSWSKAGACKRKAGRAESHSCCSEKHHDHHRRGMPLPWAGAGQCCALPVGGASRFAVTWPWALCTSVMLWGPRRAWGWSMRLLPHGQVHVETPVERTEVMGTLCALSVGQQSAFGGRDGGRLGLVSDSERS